MNARPCLLALLALLCLVPRAAWSQPANAPLATDQPRPAAMPAPVVDGRTLDAPHISATFWVRHILAPVAGRFDQAAGSIDIPVTSPDKGRVTFTARTASVDTGVVQRDEHLRSAEFFDAARYPEITFASDRIEAGGQDVFQVTGRLAIKDVTRTITVPVHFLGVKPHPMLPCVDVAGYETAVSLNRLEYHVGTGKYFQMGALGDMVDIRLAGETLAPRPNCVNPPEKQP